MVGCTGPAVVSAGSAELAIPQTLEFGPTALSFSRVKPLVVVNRARVAKTVEVSVGGPFSAPASLEVPGGAEVSLEVTFSPGAAGAIAGVLTLDGVEVALTGEGVAALECGSSTTCDAVSFDPESLSCVHTRKPDGSPCEDELACIEGGTCQAGACLGRAARCDDGNACTTDACSVGRGCQHQTLECAPPSNPCQAPTCDALLGCGSAPVQDGTPCGAVSCELANVCLAGQCRTVVPPEGFTCSPESACRGEGVCRNKACVRPAEHELSPRWTYTANTSDFRFEGVTDAQGNWYWVECFSIAMKMGTPQVPVKQPAHQCDVHSRTPDGLERFRAEVRGTGVLRGMTDKTQLITQGLFIFAVNDATLAAINVSTGVLVWQQSIAAGPSSGYQGIEALAEDGRGGLWAITREDAESSSWALVRVDVVTGRVLVRKARPSRVRGLVVDGAGRAFVLSDGMPSMLPVGREVIERVEPDGTIGFSVSASAHPPVMVLGDRLVMADDSVRSTADGSELESASSTEWTTSGWAGVSPGTARGRLRLARFTGPPPPLPPSLPPPSIALQTLDASGTRARTFTAAAEQASDAYLTAAGEALFITSTQALTRPSTPTRETRARQVHPLGLELMSCPLVDEEFPGSPTTAALRLGARSGFNGRFFAVQSLNVDCDACDLWSPPRLVFYDLGRPGPGSSRTGWTGPRGTPGGGSRAR